VPRLDLLFPSFDSWFDFSPRCRRSPPQTSTPMKLRRPPRPSAASFRSSATRRTRRAPSRLLGRPAAPARATPSRSHRLLLAASGIPRVDQALPAWRQRGHLGPVHQCLGLGPNPVRNSAQIQIWMFLYPGPCSSFP
jgi:hypothetical protein